MMEFLGFIVNNLLGPVFDHDLAMVRAQEEDDDGESACGEKVGESDKKEAKMPSVVGRRSRNAGDSILDPSGPKLIDGYQNWILFYQLIGFINLPGAPLYVSIIYRLIAFALSNYIMNSHFVFKILLSKLLNINFGNPILASMQIITFVMFTINVLIITYTSTFNLQPTFKILNTPRLCCLNRRTQNALGANTLKYALVYYIYHCLLYRMMAHDNFGQFINQFNLLEFILEYYATMVYVYNIVGLAHVDFYVRSCFGAWLLALTTNVECRKARFRHAQMRQQRHEKWHAHSASNPHAAAHQMSAGMSQFCASHLFVSLDDIQKSLNAMDDHLEVTRTIQTLSLVMINLLAFLGCGVHFLVAYDVLAKSNNYYHGLLLGLVSCNYAFLVMLTYSGDGLINYALGKLVQTVEDEYFLQETQELDDTHEQAANQSFGRMSSSNGVDIGCHEARHSSVSLALEEVTPRTTTTGIDDQVSSANKQCLLIKRSDVLFCREFIVQFEDHLATPWSKLTFKSHLQIMGTFATLVAAQIIFDSH